MPTKAEATMNIFICDVRINGAKRCFGGDECIAILEMQKRRNILWLEALFKDTK